jgi:hypothetical protein
MQQIPSSSDAAVKNAPKGNIIVTMYEKDNDRKVL